MRRDLRRRLPMLELVHENGTEIRSALDLAVARVRREVAKALVRSAMTTTRAVA